MLSKGMVAWAKQYYYMSLGLSAPAELPSGQDDKIENLYITEFAQPVTFLIRGKASDSIETEDILAFNDVVKRLKFYEIYHVIGSLYHDKKLHRTGVLTDDISNLLTELSTTYIRTYCCIAGGKPFTAFAINGSKLYGHYPQAKIVTLGDVKNFKNGVDLKYFATQNPLMLSDYCVKALSKAVKFNIIPKSELRNARFDIVRDGALLNTSVTAITPELPSYFVRSLILNLPEATKEEYSNVYEAAYAYAEEHKDKCHKEYLELQKIIKDIRPDKEDRLFNPEESSETSFELNDEIVAKYLHEKYGTPIDIIKNQVEVPTASKLFTSAYLLRGADKNLSAEELLDKVQEDPLAASGTLDELLDAFCDDEGFDKKDSVENLIRFINDEELVPRDFIAEFKNYIESSNIPMETSIEEFLEDKKHDPALQALIVLDQCDIIDKRLTEMVERALRFNKPAVIPDVIEQLQQAKVPDNILLPIKQAIESGTEVELPAHETTEDEAVTYLVKKGIPRVYVQELISTGTKPAITDADVSNYLSDKGLSSDTISSIMNGDVPSAKPDKFSEIVLIMTDYISSVKAKSDATLDERLDIGNLALALPAISVVAADTKENVLKYVDKIRADCKLPESKAVMDKVYELIEAY